MGRKRAHQSFRLSTRISFSAKRSCSTMSHSRSRCAASSRCARSSCCSAGSPRAAASVAPTVQATRTRPINFYKYSTRIKNEKERSPAATEADEELCALRNCSTRSRSIYEYGRMQRRLPRNPSIKEVAQWPVCVDHVLVSGRRRTSSLRRSSSASACMRRDSAARSPSFRWCACASSSVRFSCAENSGVRGTRVLDSNGHTRVGALDVSTH